MSDEPQAPQFMGGNIHGFIPKQLSATDQQKLDAMFKVRAIVGEALIAAGFVERGRGGGMGAVDIATTCDGINLSVQIYAP